MDIRLTSGFMLSHCHIQRSSGLHDSGVSQDDTPTRSLIVKRWISPNLAQPRRYERNMAFHTRNTHPSHLSISFFYFPKTPFVSFSKYSRISSLIKHMVIIFVWIKMSNKVLSNLAVFVIQTEHIIFRDKPRSLRNDHSNQGVAIQPWFSNKQHAIL